MCQANYFIMGEDLERTVEELADKIYLVHFRNTTGTSNHFRETFHDNGDIDMAALMRVYTNIDFMDKTNEKYALACELLCKSINLAVCACIDAGADKVYYIDGHAGGGNIREDAIDNSFEEL